MTSQHPYAIEQAIEMKLYGDDKIRAMMAAAPKAMKAAIQHFLYSTRKAYVGNRKNAGKIGRDVYNLRRGAGANSPFKREGNWDKRVSRVFGGFVNRGSGNEIGEMFLRMKPYGKSKFVSGLGMMDVSMPQMDVTSSKNMIMPAYENIKKLGYSLRGSRNKSKLIADVLGNEQTFSIRRGDSTLVFLDENRMAGGRVGLFGGRNRGAKRMKLRKSALLFVLKKHFTMKKKFDFINQFNSSQGKYIARLNNLINAQVRGLEKINPATGKTYVEMR